MTESFQIQINDFYTKYGINGHRAEYFSCQKLMWALYRLDLL